MTMPNATTTKCDLTKSTTASRSGNALNHCVEEDAIPGAELDATRSLTLYADSVKAQRPPIWLRLLSQTKERYQIGLDRCARRPIPKERRSLPPPCSVVWKMNDWQQETNPEHRFIHGSHPAMPDTSIRTSRKKLQFIHLNKSTGPVQDVNTRQKVRAHVMHDFQQHKHVRKEQDWEDLQFGLRPGKKVNLASDSQLEGVVEGSQGVFENPQKKMRDFRILRAEGFLHQSPFDLAQCQFPKHTKVPVYAGGGEYPK